MTPKTGYEQAAVYWRERAEVAEAKLGSLTLLQGIELAKAAEVFSLSQCEADLLLVLMRRAPAAIHSQVLMECMLRPRGGEGEKIIQVYIYKLRKRLDRAGIPQAIKTVWGFGYGVTNEAATEIRERMNAFDERHLLSINLCGLGANDSESEVIQAPSRSKREAVAYGV